MLIVIAMLVAISVSFISFFRTETDDEPEEIMPYDSMYNASRYFFRVFYPDDWDVSADQYGFMLNDEEGLVLEAFPLKKMAPNTPDVGTPGSGEDSAETPSPSPSASSSVSASAPVSSSPDPREGMERDNDLTMSFYYREYDEILEYIKSLTSGSDEEVEGDDESETEDSKSTLTPDTTADPESDLTPSPDGRTAPVEHDTVAAIVYEHFKAAHTDEGYEFAAARTFNAQNMDFTVMPYEYIKDDIRMSGELYIATRAMAYYIVKVDGTSSAFRRTQPVVQNMLYNMVFSVFDY